jgi:hypothetical protein
VQVAEMRKRATATPEEFRLGRVPDSLWPPGWRWCASCSSFVPEFYAQGSRCKACASVASHSAMIERTYDLTAEEYEALFELQGRACAICGQKPRTQRLAVDHDHATGAVRGLLCSRDNHETLGGAHDNVDRLRAAVAYLDSPPMSGNWTPPRPNKRRLSTSRNPAETDPSYLLFDHDPRPAPLPSVLQAVQKRMTVDQLVLSGGRSDPETGVYWLAYRRQVDEEPPF